MNPIDDYLRTIEAPERRALERIRSIAHATIPDIAESFGYGMPVLRYKDKYLLGFSAFKDHLSIFPGPEAIQANLDKLGDFKIAKGTVQFTLEQELPEKLIRSILAFRQKEIDQQTKS